MLNGKGVFACFCMSLFFFSSSFSLNPEYKLTQYMFDKWSVDNGLNLSTVNALYQSTNGYIWLGTDQGLVRFNGTEFYTIKKEGNLDVEVRAIVENKQGEIIVGTEDSGILYLENNQLVPAPYKSNSSQINSLNSNGDTLWIAGKNGLDRVDNGIVTHVWPSDSVSKNIQTPTYAMDVVFDKDGNVFCGFDGGSLLVVDENLNSKLYKVSEKIRELVNCVSVDNKGNIWIGTDFEGVFLFKDGHFIKPEFSNFIKGKQINDILSDKDNNLWIATSAGLNRWNGKTLELFDEIHGLPVNFVNRLLEDFEHSIWVGTKGGGLTRFKDSLFKCFSTTEGLIGDIVFPVLEDSQKRIWVGTFGNGLNCIKNGKIIKTLTIENGLSDNYIRTLIEDREGNIWVGTHNGFNLIQNDYKEIKQFAKGREINVMFQSSDDTIWVGTTLGILQIRNRELLKEKDFEKWGLKGSFVSDFVEMENGEIWAATLIAGLHIIKNGKVVKRFSKDDGLPEKRLHTLFIDSQGFLWITSYNGIYYYDKKKFYQIGTGNGIQEKMIYGIIEDNLHNLWFTGNSGVYKVSRSEMVKISEDRKIKINVEVFDKSNGLRSSECNGIFQPCIFKKIDGNLLFPTIKGFVEINPQNELRNTVPPPVEIEKIISNSIEFSLSTNVVFPIGSKNFEFSYSGLSYLFPSKVKYKYKIVDLDDDWYFANSRKTAYYNDLPSGNHTFRVIACNNDGVWNKKGASFDFYIKPRIREMWWFRLLLLLFIVVLGNLIYRTVKKTIKQFLKWKKQQQFGHYKIIEKLGSGGMGEVYRAQHLKGGNQVALKLLHDTFVNKSEKDRFLREGKITALMNHPNVVKIFETGELSGRLYYSMDLVSGITLREFMKKSLTVKTVLSFIRVMIDILNSLHNSSVIHRDIKPENIMIYLEEGEDIEKIMQNENIEQCFKERIRILDFGVARLTTLATMTKTGMVQGTLLYQPPEVFDGKTSPGPFFDFYAVGIICYEMLSGKIPFEGEGPMEIVFAKISSDPKSLNSMGKDIPFEVSDFVMWMIEMNHEARLKDYSQILTELNKLMD